MFKDSKSWKVFQTLKQEKQFLTEQLDQLPSSQLQTQFEVGAWSVVQVMSHLDLVEYGTFTYLTKKLSSPSSSSHSPIVTIRGWLLRTSQKLPIKYKTSSKLEDASNSKTYEDLRKNWSNHQQELESLLSMQESQTFHLPIYRNQAVGYLSIYEQLRFLLTHFRRHEKQIQQLLKKTT